jgi:hypothetical protein
MGMMILRYCDLKDINCVQVAAALLRAMPEVLRVRTNLEAHELEVLYTGSMRHDLTELAIVSNAVPLDASVFEVETE